MSLLAELLNPLFRRPLVCFVLLWMAGILASAHLALPWQAWLPAGALLLLAGWLAGGASAVVRWAAPALACFCLAAGMSAWRDTPTPPESPRFLPAGAVTVAGYPLAPPSTSSANVTPPIWNVPFHVVARQTGGAWVTADAAIYLSGQTIPPSPGTYYRITGKILPCEEAGNPYSFSWRTFLAERDLQYRLRAGDVSAMVITAPAAPVAVWRETLYRRLVATMPGNYPQLHAQLLNSLVLGAHGEPLPDEMVTQFRQAGTIHLMIVSGNQITLFAGLLVVPLLLLPFGGSRATYPRLRLLLLCLSLPLLWLYVALADSGPSIDRAIIMVLLTALSVVLTVSPLARARAYRVDGPTLLAAAALAMLIPRPALLFSAGMQITFIAILGLMTLTPVFARLLQRVFGRFAIVPAATLGASLATYPILAWHFGTLPLLSPLTNLIEEPLVTALLPLAIFTYLFALTIPPLAYLLNLLNVLLMNIILGANALVARWPWACPIYYVRSPWLILLYIAVLIAALRWLRRLADRLQPAWAVPAGREPRMW